MTRRSWIIAAALAIGWTATPVAHHSFIAEYDPQKPVLLRGKVVRIEWVNPHTWIHLEVRRADGRNETWSIEGGSPNSLFRRGVTKATITLGTEIIADGYQARDRSLRANGRNVTFADGRKLFLSPDGS
jgi:hypothetical protein